MIFMTGIVINRWAAVIWGAITLVSLFVAVQNVGPEFTYALMTRGELAELKSDLEAKINRSTVSVLFAIIPALIAGMGLAAAIG